MNFYKSFIRRLMFKLTPEKAHSLTFNLLNIPLTSSLFKLLFSYQSEVLKFEKLNFRTPNIIGLAAGLDKDASAVKQLDALGFGFIEVGTVTPLPQPGNPKPRLFRLPKDLALINRMGFNNNGAEKMKKNLQKLKRVNSLIGVNLGKNKITPLEDAHNDYLKSFKILFDYADFFTINVSSPNTPNLRELQDKFFLEKILKELQTFNKKQKSEKPLFLKIAPDLSFEQIDEIIELVKKYELKGIIATNTTIERKHLSYEDDYIEKLGQGGLSGLPLFSKSTEIVKYIKQRSEDKFLIIGVGGIFGAENVIEKLEAGADLVQIYTSFIYEGPGIVKKIKKGLVSKKLIDKKMP